MLIEVGAERAGTPLDCASEPFPLADLARVPWSPAWVRGTIYREGTVLIVVDLARFAGLGDAGPRPVVFVPQGDRQLAFAVRAATLVEGQSEDLGGSSTVEWLGVEAKVGGVAYHPLDLDRLQALVAEAF